MRARLLLTFVLVLACGSDAATPSAFDAAPELARCEDLCPGFDGVSCSFDGACTCTTPDGEVPCTLE